jgi:hypothetical protein
MAPHAPHKMLNSARAATREDSYQIIDVKPARRAKSSLSPPLRTIVNFVHQDLSSRRLTAIALNAPQASTKT